MKQSIGSVKTPIKARVIIPGSKSMTNRALLLASLAEGVSELFDILLSADTLAFIDALKMLGVSIQVNEEARTCIIAGGGMGRFPKKEASIWCADAGTVARFLLTACAASPGTYHFNGSPHLCDRPISSLMQTLRSQGAKFIPEDAEKMPFTILGADRLRGGEIEIEGVETSQFLSSFLMLAPYAKLPVVLKTQEMVSSPYVDMTCAMMADFGVLVRRMHQSRFSVPGPQRYESRDYIIEPDLSTASYFFAAAAVTGGEVIIQPIKRDESKQGDVEFLIVLEKMGCTVTETPVGLKVEGPKELKGVNADMRDFSDTFMTLAAIAPFATTPTTITNIGHTRLQESDRIAVMRKNLEALQVRVEEGHDWIKIYPSDPVAGVVDSYNDHRIAMAFSIIGLRVPGMEIDKAECVAKTCPEFFELWREMSNS